MKEATGELNLTIIVVMAVGLLIAFFYFTIWPSMNENFERNSMCSKAVCENPCNAGVNTCDEVIGQLVKCKVPKSETVLYCPWKG